VIVNGVGESVTFVEEPTESARENGVIALEEIAPELIHHGEHDEGRPLLDRPLATGAKE
jgi:hypothetical protein